MSELKPLISHDTALATQSNRQVKMPLVCRTQRTLAMDAASFKYEAICQGVHLMVFEDFRKIPLYGIPLLQSDKYCFMCPQPKLLQ